MAWRKQVESGLLLLLLGVSCIAATAQSWDQNPATGGVGIQEAAKSTRIQHSLQQAWMVFAHGGWTKTAASKPAREDLGTQGFSTTDPVAHPWPEEFTIEFTTKGKLVKGFLAYDWANKRQVIWHGPNSTYCQDYGILNDSCYILFNGTGIFVLLPSVNQCWLETPGVGTVPPDWTVYSTYQGIELVDGIGPCISFAFPPTDHAYSETLDGRPCVFVFPVPDMTYYFLPDTEVIGTPAESFFELPSYCTLESPSIRMTTS